MNKYIFANPLVYELPKYLPFQSIISLASTCTAFKILIYTHARYNLTVYNLDAVLNGEVQEFIDALQFAENAEKLTTQN